MNSNAVSSLSGGNCHATSAPSARFVAMSVCRTRRIVPARSPMYLGLLVTLLGEAAVFPHIASGLIIETACFWLGATVFVMTFEEPVLRSTFDGDYAAYCGGVRRWIPRLAPWYAPR